MADKSTEVKSTEVTLESVRAKLKEYSDKYYLDSNRPHAKYFEFAFHLLIIATAFVRFVLRKSPILPRLKLDELKIGHTTYLNSPTFKDSYADMVYTIPLKGEKEEEITVYVLMEHKSTNDYGVVRQLAKYYTQLMFFDELEQEKESAEKESVKEPGKEESGIINSDSDTTTADSDTTTADSESKAQKKAKSNRLPLVIPIVLCSGKSAYTGPTELKAYYPQIEGFENYMMNFKPEIVDLSTLDLDELYKNLHDPNELPLIIVLTVMKLVFEEDNDEAVIKRFTELFPEIAKHPEYMALVDTSIQYFRIAAHMDHTKFEKVVNTYYPQEKEEGENTVLSWLEQTQLKGRMEGRAEGRMEGRMEGRAEGLMEGRMEGEQSGIVKKARAMLLSFLNARFHSVPSRIQRRIEEIGDEIVLDSLFAEAMQCQSIEEFEKSLL